MIANNIHQLPFTPEAVQTYLTQLHGEPVQLRGIQRLATGKELKEYGYGKPLLIEYALDEHTRRVVLHTVAESSFGHERHSDRAANLLLAHATYNNLPQHVPSLDVGAINADGTLLSLGDTGEFFQLVEFIEGAPYAHDLQQIAETDQHSARDMQRVTALATYLARIHRTKHKDTTLYQRRIRDLLADGEGIIGMLDTYPTDYPLAPADWLESVEKRCVEWRWRVKAYDHRLSQVHGDFHPYNILFTEGTDFQVIDRSRGAWGDPADDVSALAVNYLLFSLQRYNELTNTFAYLWRHFWETYLDASDDTELLDVVQPFFAWRLLVIAHPLWYPSLDDEARIQLFHLLDAVLAKPHFDPMSICETVSCQ